LNVYSAKLEQYLEASGDRFAPRRMNSYASNRKRHALATCSEAAARQDNQRGRRRPRVVAGDVDESTGVKC
jgi:hypothetical protein